MFLIVCALFAGSIALTLEPRELPTNMTTLPTWQSHCHQTSGLGTPGNFPEGTHTLAFEGKYSDLFSSWTRVVRCGNPPSEANGHFECLDDRWGSVCELRCYNGYQPVGGGTEPMECHRPDPNGTLGEWRNVRRCEPIP
ncbi:unnamed protein product [Owenia fusiformis]|uniref:Sushi domain-containing protein n=1 Tax=Owenia fusiformis TaxID=6347 RepID=A0A8S4Q3M4_OWEFU|nr:unnamed protein product [Owenia fusiformis]